MEEGYTRYYPRHTKPCHHKYTFGQGRVAGAVNFLCFLKAFCTPTPHPENHRDSVLTRHCGLLSTLWCGSYTLCSVLVPESSVDHRQMVKVFWDRLWNIPGLIHWPTENLETGMEDSPKVWPQKVCKKQFFWDNPLIKKWLGIWSVLNCEVGNSSCVLTRAFPLLMYLFCKRYIFFVTSHDLFRGMLPSRFIHVGTLANVELSCLLCWQADRINQNGEKC